MNSLENWFCASAFWRNLTRRELLPWMVSGSELGDHLLELGSGPGATTGELRRMVGCVTSLEYDKAFAARLRASGKSDRVVQGDAAALPFADGTFSSAIAVLMLHHLKTKELQDRAFLEVRRVLRPGGVFLALEIPDGWFNRAIHLHSTFVPVDPAAISAKLVAAGFASATVNHRRGGFCMRALRARES